MKSSNKPNVFVGIILLLASAFFSVALLLQGLDFGILGPGRNNILFSLGEMLFSVYGYSSIFIPLFLFVAAISCFTSKWTAQKSMRLLTAVIPFFTAVGTEKICNSIKQQSTSDTSTIKIAGAITTGLMLIIVEFLIAGLIANKFTTKNLEEDFDSSTEEKDEEEKNKIIRELQEISEEITKDWRIGQNLSNRKTSNIKQLQKEIEESGIVLTEEERKKKYPLN